MLTKNCFIRQILPQTINQDARYNDLQNIELHRGFELPRFHPMARPKSPPHP